MDRLELATMRGEEASQLLANPLFAQAFGDTRAAILATWAALPTSDTENAYDLHRMVKCLDKVRKCLDEHITTGKLARIEVDGREKRRLFGLKVS